jgi:hypothetical protein
MSEFLHVWRGNGNESLVLLPVKSLLRQLVTWAMAVGGGRLQPYSQRLHFVRWSVILPVNCGTKRKRISGEL